jgi:predicted SAM-dependent methyltransferase
MFNLKSGKTLDVGCRWINGAVRDLFDDYTGLDIEPGLNVDIVCNAHKIPFDDNFFDTVCCLEMLEHDTNFFESIAECHRVLKPGGFFLLSARGNGYEKHDYPNDYWRFTEDGFNLLLASFTTQTSKENLLGIFGWAQK